MIPDFDENGYLPPGIHVATLADIEVRFGTETEVRRVEFESLTWFLQALEGSFARRIVINGSFVTAAKEPNDVDVAVLLDDNTISLLPELEALLDGLPFLDVEFLSSRDFDLLVGEVYATDRRDVHKGLVEIPI